MIVSETGFAPAFRDHAFANHDNLAREYAHANKTVRWSLQWLRLRVPDAHRGRTHVHFPQVERNQGVWGRMQPARAKMPQISRDAFLAVDMRVWFERAITARRMSASRHCDFVETFRPGR
ncbi:MAG: hypothetical protein KL840_16315 [Aquamicrobium sp.]|nr:hypothetical protein [Aquamicrobium sp.]